MQAPEPCETNHAVVAEVIVSTTVWSGAVAFGAQRLGRLLDRRYAR